jgi:hypothetical protein
MGVAGGPDLIQDGLVLSLDASDRNSYVSGSSTWFDLSGLNNSGSLTNGPTFSSANLGSIVFDGVDDYINLGNTTINIGTGSMSVSMWAKPTAFFGVNAFYYSIGSNQTGFYGIGCASNGAPFFATTPGGGITILGNAGSIITNNWYNLVGTRTNGVIRLYLNGNLVGTPVTSSGVFNTTNARIATNADASSEKLQGSVSALTLYTRSLSADEVLQNYNAQKSKFGL